MTQRVSIVLARFGQWPLCKRGRTMASTKKHLFCTKNMNLRKCPELLSIERYWATTKRILKKKNKTINNISQFKRDLERAPSAVESSIVQAIMEPIERQVMAFYMDKIELSTLFTKSMINYVVI